jgi:GTPase
VTPSRHDHVALYAAAVDGDRVALARLMSAVERGGAGGRAAGAACFPHSGRAYTVGITGAPGSGKSTLTSALAGVVRRCGGRMAVLAVDPSSPFTGGAILGDRVRMQEHATDDAVYIRSMATRGNLGGLALATPQAVRVLDAVGWPWVVVETVGVGQVEVAIAGEADTTVVVVNPGWGDAVQANKAGLMEVADLFVVNKADRPGAQDTRRDILQMLELSHISHADGGDGWEPPVVLTAAVDGDGADELWEAVGRHRHHLESTGALAARREARLRREVRAVLHHRIAEQVQDRTGGPDFADLERRVLARELDPHAAVDLLMGDR